MNKFNLIIILGGLYMFILVGCEDNSAAIRIRSNPKDCPIYIDDEYVGTTPIDVFVDPGDHVIAVLNKDDNEEAFEKRYTITPKTAKTIDAEFTSVDDLDGLSERVASRKRNRQARIAKEERERKARLAKEKQRIQTAFKNHNYKTVRIGNQVWMAENLNIEIESSACYGDDPANCATYGRLYTWEQAKKIADQIPGWHLPTNEEWDELCEALGGTKDSYGNYPGIGTKLKQGGSSGLDLLLAGYRTSGGNFNHLGDYGFFWSSSPDGSSSAWYRRVRASYSYVNRYSTNRARLFPSGWLRMLNSTLRRFEIFGSSRG